MKLLKIEIQDGENTYFEYAKVKDEIEAEEFINSFLGEDNNFLGEDFERAVKNAQLFDLSADEQKVLEKLHII